jgi:hypothetical protein
MPSLMFYRIALLCLSLLLIASGTASAVQADCPASDARQMAHVMPTMDAECDMGMASMDSSYPADEDEDGPSHDMACCCPAVVAALPSAAAPEGHSDLYPPLFNTPLDASPVSVASVPEPPPPRA